MKMLNFQKKIFLIICYKIHFSDFGIYLRKFLFKTKIYQKKGQFSLNLPKSIFYLIFQKRITTQKIKMFCRFYQLK